MTINVGKCDIVGVVGILAIAGLSYLAMKKNKKADKEFEDHKKEVLDGVDLDYEIKRCSTSNDKLSVEDRAVARDILTKQKNIVESAKDSDSFDSAWKKFNSYCEDFMNGEPEEIASNVLYAKNTIDAEKKKAEEAAVRQHERDNYNTIADAIKSITKTYMTYNRNGGSFYFGPTRY